MWMFFWYRGNDTGYTDHYNITKPLHSAPKQKQQLYQRQDQDQMAHSLSCLDDVNVQVFNEEQNATCSVDAGERGAADILILKIPSQNINQI
jgi:hypothetical protein